MKILAFEFSSAQRSIALVVREPPTASGPAGVEVENEMVETGSPSTRALEMVEELLRQSQVEREQIDRLAVGLGPGSYTGIRAGIALAQGWHLARPVKLLGISSAECLAAQAWTEGVFGRVAVVIDAQRGEFYLSNFEVDAQGYRELRPLRLAAPAEVTAAQQGGELLVGPELAKWFPRGHMIFPRATTLARLALNRTNHVAPETLEPIYLREISFVKSPPSRVLPR